MGLREAIGETEFEQQQILGYAPVEPDGSFKLQVPADTPLALSVIDAKGRAHPDPHSTGSRCARASAAPATAATARAAAARSTPAPIVNTHAGGADADAGGAHQSGETMASLRTRLDPTALDAAAPTWSSADVWADTTQAGVTARAVDHDHATPATPNAADDLATPVPANGIINYPRAHRAALDARPRRQHLHQLPRRPGQARPARRHRRAPAASRRTRSCCSATR